MSPNENYRKPPGSRVVVGGIVAGILAGIVMGFSASAYSGAGTGGWSLPWQMIAATYYGPMAFVGGAGVTTIGVFTHFFIAVVFGVIFAGLTRPVRSVAFSLVLGIVYAIAVWAFMTYVTLAVINETMRVRVALHPVWWYFLHWIYGGVLGLIMPGLRPRRRVRMQEAPVQEQRREPATVGAASTPSTPAPPQENEHPGTP